MSKLITLVFGVLLLWAVFHFGARSQAPVIQDDIQHRTAAAVADAGYTDVSVTTDGRDVTLVGEVADDESVLVVGDIANAVRGVRVVDNMTSVADPYLTRFCKDETTITLSGNVPSDDEKGEFPERARDMFRYWEVNENLEVRTDSPEGFLRFMDQALIELGQLDAGCITFTGDSLLIKGSVRSERAADGIKRRMDEHSDLGFDVSYELTLPQLSDEARACQEEANKRVAVGETVLFSFDSDVVHEIGRQLLDEVVEISKLCPDVGIVVSGHTDSVGDKDYNIALGDRRAQAVVAYMVNKGVAAERLSAVGLGFSQPVADNSTKEGRAQNRRIEFRARED